MKAGINAGKPDYVRYRSVARLEEERSSMTEASEGFYGEVTGSVSGISHTDRLPEQLNREFSGDFPSGKRGYEKGSLRDSEGEMEIWLRPGLSVPEKEARYQFCCLPGREGTVMLLHVLEN